MPCYLVLKVKIENSDLKFLHGLAHSYKPSVPMLDIYYIFIYSNKIVLNYIHLYLM